MFGQMIIITKKEMNLKYLNGFKIRILIFINQLTELIFLTNLMFLNKWDNQMNLAKYVFQKATILILKIWFNLKLITHFNRDRYLFYPI